MFRKAMLQLGLAYEDDEEGTDSGRAIPEPPPAVGASGDDDQQGSVRPSYPDEPSGIGSVRPIGGRGGDADHGDSRGHTVQPSGGSGAGRGRTPRLRPIPVVPNAKPQVILPTSFNHAQLVADAFKNSQPVIMNLLDAERELARRLIDFASGLCYGLGGRMERLDAQVYLLTPSNVVVSSAERQRLSETDYQP